MGTIAVLALALGATMLLFCKNRTFNLKSPVKGSKLWQFTKTILAGMVIIFVFVSFIKTWADVPLAYYSFSQQRCVKVESPDPKDSCDNMPKRYTVVWLQ